MVPPCESLLAVRLLRRVSRDLRLETLGTISSFPAPVYLSPYSTNNRVAHAKGLLQVMREETDAMKKGSSRAKPSEVRVRENLQNTLTRKFVDLAKDYQNRQVIGGSSKVPRRPSFSCFPDCYRSCPSSHFLCFSTFCLFTVDFRLSRLPWLSISCPLVLFLIGFLGCSFRQRFIAMRAGSFEGTFW